MPGSGTCGRIRQRKSCSSSSGVGALNAMCSTPCGSTLPTTCRTMPPLPEVSMPWRTSSTLRLLAPPRAAANSRSCRADSSRAPPASAFAPAALFPSKPGVEAESTAPSSNPSPTRSNPASAPGSTGPAPFVELPLELPLELPFDLPMSRSSQSGPAAATARAGGEPAGQPARDQPGADHHRLVAQARDRDHRVLLQRPQAVVDHVVRGQPDPGRRGAHVDPGPLVELRADET